MLCKADWDNWWPICSSYVIKFPSPQWDFPILILNKYGIFKGPKGGGYSLVLLKMLDTFLPVWLFIKKTFSLLN